MDELAWVLAFIAPDRFGGFQGAEAVQAQPTENPADRGRGDTGFGGDLLARPALAPQPLNFCDNCLRRRPAQAMRLGRAIPQSRQSLASIAINPFSHRARADACGFGKGLRRLPSLDLQL